MGNSNTSSSGTLPSNTITNPRCEARAITTRSGLSYTPVPPIPPPLYDENEPLNEKETEVTKDKVLPSTKDIQPPVIQKSHDPVSSPISPEPSSAQVDNSPPSKEPSKKTRLPYPSRVEHEKKGENDKVQIQKFWEMFKKIHVDITLADALILMPKYQKMLKSLLSNKEKLNEMANTPVSETCSAIILKKLPEKLGDPGQFLIPCNFSELKCKALADLGIARDVLVPVGRFTFPADFVVVDFECNYQVPLILGRPFLRTARVLIDVHGEELVIRDGMERIVFKPDGSQDKESIHMMDIYDDRVKDVCEPKNDDSSTSTIVEEFESLLEKIIKQKKKLREYLTPVTRKKVSRLFQTLSLRKKMIFPLEMTSQFLDDLGFYAVHPNTIHTPVSQNVEPKDSLIMGDGHINTTPETETISVETLVSNPSESDDFSLGECNLFDIDDSYYEKSTSRLAHLAPISPEIVEACVDDDDTDDDDDYDDDFYDCVDIEEDGGEIDFDISKIVDISLREKLVKSYLLIEKINAFSLSPPIPISPIFCPSSTIPVVDLDLPLEEADVPSFSDDSMILSEYESFTFDDEPVMAEVNVFDPLHPPLMDFHVTKAFFGFSGFWKIHGSKLWKDKAMPTISIDDLQSSLHKMGNLLSLKGLKRQKEAKRSKTDRTGEKNKEQEQDKEISQKSQRISNRHPL
ncbi:reverse transcriptase domain-containing protein [Tanacetum coccineum]